MTLLTLFTPVLNGVHFPKRRADILQFLTKQWRYFCNPFVEVLANFRCLLKKIGESGPTPTCCTAASASECSYSRGIGSEITNA